MDHRLLEEAGQAAPGWVDGGDHSANNVYDDDDHYHNDKDDDDNWHNDGNDNDDV